MCARVFVSIVFNVRVAVRLVRTSVLCTCVRAHARYSRPTPSAPARRAQVVALGLRLKKAGLAVTLLAAENEVDFAIEYGFDFGAHRSKLQNPRLH